MKIGKYEILEEIGKGGMGKVYKARDPIIERHVAIKVIIDSVLEVPEYKERFYREARAAGNINHENITIVYDVGEEEGRPYIVMEYLQGVELRELITKTPPLPLQTKLDYAIQVCRGLERAHKTDIVHRDIKPENIQVLDDGKVKIMDFGIARPTASTMTMTGITIGTPYYMSPEQVRGKRVSKQSDIFSFGVVLYELLTGKKPFEGGGVETVMYKIVHEEPEPIVIEGTKFGPDLQKLISKCLEKDIDRRYQDFSEVISDLKKIIRKEERHHTTTDADIVKTIPLQARREPAKRSSGLILAGVAVLVAAGVVGGLWFTNRPLLTGGTPDIDIEQSENPPSLQETLTELAAARKRAEEADAPSLATDPFTAASDIEKKGLEASEAGNYPAAESLLTAAANEFAEAADFAKSQKAALKDRALTAKAEVLSAQKAAGKARSSSSYQKGERSLDEGESAFSEGDFTSAARAYEAATDLFRRAATASIDRPKPTPAASRFEPEAQSARTEAAETRRRAEQQGAQRDALEAYQYGLKLEGEGHKYFGDKKYKDAIQSFESASTAFERALSEQQSFERAQKAFRSGDYKQSLTHLDPIFSDQPYRGDNKKARSLYDEVKMAENYRTMKLKEAQAAAGKDDIRTAYALLSSLPARDKERPDIKKMLQSVISKDGLPPVIDHKPSTKYDPAEPLDLLATVQDNLNVSSVTLFYNRKGTDSYIEAEMTSRGKGQYAYAVTQDYHKTKEIRYYFRARDAKGNERTLGSEKKPFKIKSEDKGITVPQIP